VIIEIVKHIGKSGQQHASGSFEIAKNASPLGCYSDATPVTMFPQMNLGNKVVTFVRGMDRSHLQKDFPQVFGIGSFGVSSAPTEALSLNVHQTTLNDDRWPKLAQCPGEMGITVDGSGFGPRAPFGQGTAKSAQILGTFGNVHHAMHYRVIFSIHGNKQPFGSLHEGPIQDQVLTGRQVAGKSRQRTQPVVDDPLDGCSAVTTLLGQLSKGIALYDPSPKPDLLS